MTGHVTSRKANCVNANLIPSVQFVLLDTLTYEELRHASGVKLQSAKGDLFPVLVFETSQPQGVSTLYQDDLVDQLISVYEVRDKPP